MIKKNVYEIVNSGERGDDLLVNPNSIWYKKFSEIFDVSKILRTKLFH